MNRSTMMVSDTHVLPYQGLVIPQREVLSQQIQACIKDVPDFPKEGILFKDLMPVLANPEVFHALITTWVEALKPLDVTHIVGMESRGFLFGVPLAHALGVSFVPVRKPGKLPGATYQQTYALEYGEDTLELQQDALTKGSRVVIVDDLLATGGTAGATHALIQQTGATTLGLLFVVALSFLHGETQLTEAGFVDALVVY
ncbi:MAG: adenine phosphoribosyltransferase [Vampirovibrionales bacterium]